METVLESVMSYRSLTGLFGGLVSVAFWWLSGPGLLWAARSAIGEMYGEVEVGCCVQQGEVRHSGLISWWKSKHSSIRGMIVQLMLLADNNPVAARSMMATRKALEYVTIAQGQLSDNVA